MPHKSPEVWYDEHFPSDMGAGRSLYVLTTDAGLPDIWESPDPNTRVSAYPIALEIGKAYDFRALARAARAAMMNFQCAWHVYAGETPARAFEPLHGRSSRGDLPVPFRIFGVEGTPRLSYAPISGGLRTYALDAFTVWEETDLTFAAGPNWREVFALTRTVLGAKPTDWRIAARYPQTVFEHVRDTRVRAAFEHACAASKAHWFAKDLRVCGAFSNGWAKRLWCAMRSAESVEGEDVPEELDEAGEFALMGLIAAPWLSAEERELLHRPFHEAAPLSTAGNAVLVR